MAEAGLRCEIAQACNPSKHEYEKIRRRVARLIALRKANSETAQLPKDIRELLAPLAVGTTRVRIETEHRADKIAAATVDNFLTAVLTARDQSSGCRKIGQLSPMGLIP